MPDFAPYEAARVRERLTTSTRTHVATSEYAAELAALPERGEMSDGAALAVASWYAGHDASGLIMAELSTTGSVVLGELLDAIYAERQSTAKGDAAQERALDLLATWALNHPSRVKD